MPSAPSGRYQSRLFNFLNRQSQRLADRLDSTVRHLKVAAVWGAQILLYPMYLMVQAGLAAGRQISTSARERFPQLQTATEEESQDNPPTSDTPIQRVLEELQSLEFQGQKLAEGLLGEGEAIAFGAGLSPIALKVENLQYYLEPCNLQLVPPANLQLVPSSKQYPTNETDLSETADEITNHKNETDLSETADQITKQRCLIRGVGSLLETRTLVLVTRENQILDILTQEQQQKLSAKIILGVADLRRQWRLAQEKASKVVSIRFSGRDNPHVLPPIRVFWELMAWVQTSPVAIAANLFQESTLVQIPSTEPPEIIPLIPTLKLEQLQPVSNQETTTNVQIPQQALAFLDNTFAELESHQLIPGTEAVVVLGERAQKFIQRLQTQSISSGSGNSAQSLEESQTNTFRIQALIYAAINYFFGKTSSNLPQNDFQGQGEISGKAQGDVNHLSGNDFSALPSGEKNNNLEFVDSVEPDPWLNWSDLYGNSETANQVQVSTSGTPLVKGKSSTAKIQLPEAFNSKTPVKPGNSTWGFLKRNFSFLQVPGKLAVPSTDEPKIEDTTLEVPTGKLTVRTETPPLQKQDTNRDIAVTKKQVKSPVPQRQKSTVTAPVKKTAVSSSSNKSIAQKKVETTSITTPSQADPETNLEPAHDWIETKATPSGYVKHPLEQILEWLDAAILWLEELFVKVWRWMHRRF
ncbi:MAG: hypothetical protein U7123_02410 [Potamolinea sp.]